MNTGFYKKDIISILSSLFWTATLVCYYFQFPFFFIAKYIVPSFFLYIVCNLRNWKLKNEKLYIILFFFFYLYISAEMINSLYNSANLSKIIRFLQILYIIPFCFFIKKQNFSDEFRVFIIISILKALFIIGIAFYMFISTNNSEWPDWLKSRMIYYARFRNGKILIPRIQERGQALLPFCFMLYAFYTRKINLISIILIAGTLFAGNFAYILGLICYFLFLLYKKISNDKKLIILPLVIFLLLCVIPFFCKYMQFKIKQKSKFSNVVRIEQTQLLLDTNLLIGHGLGSSIVGKTTFNNYKNEDVYYELQTLYIFNQIGFLGLLLFYLVNIFGFYKIKKKKNNILLYLIYLFYSFWNPYCFDTTQMIVIVILINVQFGNLKLINNISRLE